MRRLLSIKLLVLGLLAACVTVNVYFPAAAAEQAADRIIDTVTAPTQSRPKETESPPSSPPSSRADPAARPVLVAAAAGLLNLLVPVAEAQGAANLDVSGPEIRAVTASMQQRFGSMKKYFDSGVIGLTADGMVTVRDANAAPLAERAVVTRLVTEDNRDRATLYAEIAKANKHPEWQADIRRTFARRWVERGAQPGWYYQDASGRWARK